MARHNGIRTLTIALLALLIPCAAARAADLVIPEPEAPTTIFSARLGSADVSLDLLGSWTAGISYCAGLLMVPGQDIQALDAFPSLATGFAFSQTPDITVSLSLFERYFLNVSIVGDIANDWMQLAYKGMPGEALRSVIIGTGDVTIPPTGLVQIPDQAAGTLAASAQLASGDALNDILLRWDAAKRRQKTFVGSAELVEEEHRLSSYARGRYFFLPDTGVDSGSLMVLIEAKDGAYQGSADGGRRYRLAAYDDAVLDSANGLVSLTKAAAGRVLVYYTKAGAPVGTTSTATLPLDVDLAASLGAGHWTRDASASKPFSWSATYFGAALSSRRVAVTGIGDCLLIGEPGDSSPFEVDNSYAFASTPPDDASRISFSYARKDASASPPAGLVFRSLPSEKRFQVVRSLVPRSGFDSFYPFPDADGLLYGPNRDGLAGALDYAILVQMLVPVTGYTLEQNIVEGSVQATVNGITETRFTVDAKTGSLTFGIPILSTDRIVVTYRTTTDQVTGGDVLLAWRGEIPLADWATLTLGAGIRWNANPWTFSQEPYEKSGTVIASAGIEGKAGVLTYSAEAAVAYTNPDTSGIIRLFGMEGESIAVNLSEEYAFPAAAPVELADGLVTGLTQANRGRLLYRNYRGYGSLGSVTLLPLDTSTPSTAVPYDTGGRMGPYNVLGTSAGGSTSAANLVLEYALDAIGPSWVGAQIPVQAGTDTDLSGARAITVRYKVIAATGTARLYVQLGATSEDLDGSGALKAEGASTDAGFPFVDSAHGVTLKVGAGPRLTGNGMLDTEDRNANSLLDLEDSARVATLTATGAGSLAAGSDWVTATCALTDVDRQKLLRTRCIRLIIAGYAAAEADEASGTVVVDSLSIQAAPFSARPASAAERASIMVRQVAEGVSAADPGAAGRFDAVFPETYKKFHPDSETNEVLEIGWGSATAGFSVTGFTSAGTGGIQYRTVVSHLRSAVAGAAYTFSLADAMGARIQWTVSAPDAAWHEVRVSAEAVLLDGTSVGAPEAFDSPHGSLSILTVGVPSGAGAGAGGNLLYLDEVYCTDPQGSLGAALIATAAARLPGAILSVAGYPLVSNLLVREDASLESAGFAPLYGVPTSQENLTSRTHAEVEVAFARVKADLALTDVGGVLGASGGHSVTLPTSSFPVTVTDSFALTTAGGFSRDDTATATVGSLGSLSLSSLADADDDTGRRTGLLTQSWKAAASVGAFSPVAISATLSLSQSSDGYALADEWYGARWAREAGLLLPWDGGAVAARAEALALTAGMPAAPVGFALDAKASVAGSDYAADSFAQASSLSAAVSLLLRLGEGEEADTLAVSYGRSLSLTTAPSPGAAFQAESGAFAALMAGQAYLLEAVPVWELFTDQSSAIRPCWEQAGVGTYSPSLSLRYARGSGARILDLFLPESVECVMGQDLGKKGDLWKAQTYVRPKLTTHAVNLFGTLGMYPIIPLARTDEYSLTASASIEGAPGVVPVVANLTVAAFMTLTGPGEDALTFMDAFQRTQADSVACSNDVQAILDWRLSPAGGVRIPLLDPALAATAHWENRESLEATVAWVGTGSYAPFTLLAGHSTALVFAKAGRVKAIVKAGTSAEDNGAGSLTWRLAFSASLEATLAF
jgi:hypothetical protein